MKRYDSKILVLNDNDMNCGEKTIDQITLSDIGFSSLVIKDYNLIIYSGKKGTKLLKNSLFGKTGIIG